MTDFEKVTARRIEDNAASTHAFDENGIRHVRIAVMPARERFDRRAVKSAFFRGTEASALLGRPQPSSLFVRAEPSAFLGGAQPAAFLVGAETAPVFRCPQVAFFLVRSQASAVFRGPEAATLFTGAQQPAFLAGTEAPAFLVTAEQAAHQAAPGNAPAVAIEAQVPVLDIRAEQLQPVDLVLLCGGSADRSRKRHGERGDDPRLHQVSDSFAVSPGHANASTPPRKLMARSECA